MATFTAGTSFTDGVTGDVTAAKLGALVADATPLSNFITDRTAETSVATDDLLLISDTSDSGALNKMTVANLMKAELTGTINSTSGTIATLNSTTGTIPTLVATTLVTTGTGTAAAPAIVPTGDTNTGVFYPAADTIAATTNGTERLRIDSSGRVGIGATTVNALLDIAKSDNTGSVSDFPSIRVTNTNSTLGNNTSTYNYARIDVKSGNGVVFADFGARYDSSYSGAYLGAESVHPLIFQTGGTERLRIDSSGNVGIGTSSPGARLSVDSSTSGLYATFNSTSTNGGYLEFQSIGTVQGDIGTAKQIVSGSTSDFAVNARGARNLVLGTNNTERLRITSEGNFLVGKTQADNTAVGAWINTNGKGLFTSSADAPLAINRLTNDGGLVEFFQATILEGTISVSGTTVSYNGGHLSRFSQLPSGQRDPAIKKGTVLSNLDEMCVWNDAEGNPLPNEQLNKVKISDVEGDSNVAGVFVNWDNDDQDNPFDLNMAMTGDMIIRIAQGVTVSRGDLLMSAGDGTAKPQGDDTRKAKTIAKVTSTNVTCTYEDGSYCVPCVLMAC